MRIDIDFVFPRLASQIYTRKVMNRVPMESKPDLDNLIKLVLDAITNIVIKDDSTVAEMHCRKLRAHADWEDRSNRKEVVQEDPHTLIKVWPMELAARLECDAHKARIKSLQEELRDVRHKLSQAMQCPPGDPAYDVVHETYNAACLIVGAKQEASDD